MRRAARLGVSRTRYYEWKQLADRYGTEALRPKGRRRPQPPNATPTHVIEQLLTLAVLEPTLGARRLADRLSDAGWPMAASTAQKYLHEAGLGTRRQRIARAALVAAAAGGIVTEAARDAEPMGFCHVSAGPGELVSVDSFYIGNLKGVGRVYQLTAVDVFTRWATVAVIVGTPTGAVTARFIDQLVRHWRRHGYQLRAVITDNGPEYIAHDFRVALAAKAIRHVRIPARSPNHKEIVSYCTSWCWLGQNSSVEVAALAFDQAGIAGDGWVEEPGVAVVGFVAGEQAGTMPGLDGRCAHAELLGDLGDGELAGSAEAVASAWQLTVPA